MPNNFATTNWVSMKILWFFKNSYEIAAQFNSEWESEFGKSFAVGSQVQIKYPQRWLVTDGLAYQEQGISRLVTTVNLDRIKGVHFGWDSYERLVKMERSEKELEESYLYPAGQALAQKIDSDAADWARIYAANVVGTLGTDSTTVDFALAAEQLLFAYACPAAAERYLCVSPQLMRSYVKNNVTQFNPQKAISDMYRQGVIGDAAGWKWVRSNSLARHTCGTAPTGGVTVTGAGQSGATLTVTGTATQTINPGDKFNVAAVNAVNPMTRVVNGLGLKQFTYVGGAPFILSGGADTIPIAPAIFPPGSQYQNVDAVPANAAALTFWPGTTTPSGLSGQISLGLSKYAFAKAFGKFENPEAVEKAERAEDPETGASVAFVRAWDQFNRKMTNRFDCCYGFGNLNLDYGVSAVAGA
ncbi:MAG TPA: P22 phage major capsid protein family protein [Candidatus Nitrosotalea sp.]|nr:P22 phage major capsid protein family protein [Candidatus Nitrosotalea sp.]